MPPNASLEHRVEWHKVHAFARARRPVPDAMRKLIAAQRSAALSLGTRDKKSPWTANPTDAA